MYSTVVLYLVNAMYSACVRIMYVYTRTWAISKVTGFVKIFQLPIISRRILAPDVFNYADSKSEIWHHAKKVREVFICYKSSHLFLMKNCVYVGAFIQLKNITKTVGAGMFLKIMLENLHLF